MKFTSKSQRWAIILTVPILLILLIAVGSIFVGPKLWSSQTATPTPVVAPTITPGLVPTHTITVTPTLTLTVVSTLTPTVALTSTPIITPTITSADPNPSVQPYLIGWFSRIDQLDALAGQSASGANFVMPYGGAGSPDDVRRYLDAAQRFGIKVLIDMHAHPSEWEPPTLEEYQREVHANKDHPALYGWYVADEPEAYADTEGLGYLQPVYDTFKAEDPNHPVAVIHNETPDANWISVYDTLMIDYYPGWTKYDPKEFNWMVRKSYPIWRDGIAFAKQHGKQGFIAVALGFGQDENGQPRNGTRDLTYKEYRFHVLSAVVSGASGVLFYKQEWADANVQQLVGKLITQIRSIGAEMNNGTTNDPQIRVSENSDRLVYRYGVNQQRHVILAVNIAGYNANDSKPGPKLIDVRFKVPTGIQSVTVLDENRTLPVDATGTFVDSFEPFAVHAYAFSDLGAESASPLPTNR